MAMASTGAASRRTSSMTASLAPRTATRRQPSPKKLRVRAVGGGDVTPFTRSEVSDGACSMTAMRGAPRGGMQGDDEGALRSLPFVAHDGQFDRLQDCIGRGCHVGAHGRSRPRRDHLGLLAERCRAPEARRERGRLPGLRAVVVDVLQRQALG